MSATITHDMLTLFVQLMDMGFAGYLRRFRMCPVKALWPPSCLPSPSTGH